MRSGFVVLGLLLFFYLNGKSQTNLVLNPSLEDTVACPYGLDQVVYARYWFKPTPASSDYFNSCTNNSSISVPQNSLGFQPARTGTAYGGVITYVVNLSNHREYISGKLSDSLMQGEKYCVEFYVSLADSFNTSSNTIGAYFSDSFYINNTTNLPFVPQVENIVSNSLNNKISWVKVSGYFTASGGERFITIGNFRDDNNTDTTCLDWSLCGTAYYYIDDVSVYLCSDTIPLPQPTGATIFVPSAFSPNGDGQNDILYARSDVQLENFEFAVYDRIGELVFKTNDLAQGWDGNFKGQRMNGTAFFFYLKGSYNGIDYLLKGDVTIIR
ncbi:MAG: gliding motility-associated C-terminal domain-containing protein [Bacteroidota bacterium]